MKREFIRIKFLKRSFQISFFFEKIDTFNTGNYRLIICDNLLYIINRGIYHR